MLSRDARVLADWLTGLARQGLGDAAWTLDRQVDPHRAEAFMREFADEAGDRRPIDGLLISQNTAVPAPTDLLDACRHKAAFDPALSLWLAVLHGKAPVVNGAGALFPDLRERGIETWTEAELSGLHALSRLGPSQARRVRSAAEWLVKELQPDNGTNRPWAAHVFLNLWCETGDPSFGMYAQTLVHNCRVTLGVPDRLSSLILANSAGSMSEG